ncbi:MAG: hypothetical protein FIB08_16875 [Candidatus Methanoperedens sp.]|nr:hypothetical protein [Candidatus Methanoperedens sp.]
MGLFNKIGKALDILLTEENANYTKGVEFEKYVVDLINKSTYFSIVDWTRDLSDKHSGVEVESDHGPDLIVRHKITNDKIAIECKFRSNLYGDKLAWTVPDKLEEYNHYSRENKIPMFVVIGLGGQPTSPGRMFCIPLWEAKYPELYPSVFERYERSPDKSFFWKDNILR